MPPWAYYASLGTLLLGLAGAARRRRRGLIGSALCALLTTRFCVRRLRQASRASRHVAEMLVTSALIPPLGVFVSA